MLQRWRWPGDTQELVCSTMETRGSQYTSQGYQDLLKQHGIEISMSRKGDCYDNALMESFFGKFKEECVEQHTFKTRAEARQVIFEHLEVFYNRQRKHSSLGYVS